MISSIAPRPVPHKTNKETFPMQRRLIHLGGGLAVAVALVSGAQAEDVPGGLMLVGAYGVIAVLLLLFLLRQRSQLQALAERITALRGEIERKGAEQNQR